jgi:hypothetical protein
VLRAGRARCALAQGVSLERIALGARYCLPRGVAHSCWGSGPPLGAFARDLQARGRGSGGSGVPVTFAAPSGFDFYREWTGW